MSRWLAAFICVLLGFSWGFFVKPAERPAEVVVDQARATEIGEVGIRAMRGEAPARDIASESTGESH